MTNIIASKYDLIIYVDYVIHRTMDMSAAEHGVASDSDDGSKFPMSQGDSTWYARKKLSW